LAEQNIEAAPGSFGEQGKQTFQYTLRYKGRLQSQEEFENIVIRANSDGQVLRLKDIATIELGRLTYGFSNNVNGHPAVTVIVFQTAGSNATAIINDILDLLEKSESTFPPGVKVNISQNANDFLFASIHEVVKTLIEAFILVFIVVYIFLQDLRSTLIPAYRDPGSIDRYILCALHHRIQYQLAYPLCHGTRHCHRWWTMPSSSSRVSMPSSTKAINRLQLPSTP